MAKQNHEGTVINFMKAREAQLEERRRKYNRVLFKHILGAYCAIEGEGLKAVELVDVSSEGLSFQLPADSKNLATIQSKKEFTFRLYFSEDTFIPVHAKVQNTRECLEDGNRYLRFGCSVNTKLQSYETFHFFVSFLSSYIETSHQDKGDQKVSFF